MIHDDWSNRSFVITVTKRNIVTNKYKYKKKLKRDLQMSKREVK